MNIGELNTHLATIEAFLNSLDTCHQCGGSLIIDDTPTYCAEGGCSVWCEDHDGPECEPKSELLRAARLAIAALKKPTKRGKR